MAHEHEIRGIAGWPMVFLLAAVVLAASAGLVLAAREAMVEGILLSSLVIAIACACFAGLTVVNPNQAKVVTLFGVYKGSLKAPGLLVGQSADDAPPAVAARAQLRERQAEGERPRRQSDRDRRRRRLAHRRDGRGRVQRRRLRALRARADRGGGAHPGDDLPVRRARRRPDCPCARRSARSRTGCAHEIQERLAKAGIEVIEARISHLAYAPEIAGAMLRRQQASAIIAARQKIVEGAVGMVEMALDEISRKERRRTRRGAQGGDGEQSARRAVQRSRRRSPS